MPHKVFFNSDIDKKMNGSSLKKKKKKEKRKKKKTWLYWEFYWEIYFYENGFLNKSFLECCLHSKNTGMY